MMLLTGSCPAQIAASQADAEVCRAVVPFDFRLVRADHATLVAGASGTVTDYEISVDATVVSEALAPAAGAGEKIGSWDIPLSQKIYPAGSVLRAKADTAANTTIEAGSSVTFSIVPV